MPGARENLRRLLNPRHIACIGGTDAALSARQCLKLFDGPVWGVNPKRETLGGAPCFASVDDLPQAPDAVFLAVPRASVIDTLRALNRRGAGGVACFTAGYAELGDSGREAERELIEAAGDMALVGPNCYGLINYTLGEVLWPFGAGEHRADRGIALVMQSGMLPANLTMNDRSVPITYVISVGNQSILTIEDFVNELVDDARVTAFGLYIEGIVDIDRFATAAIRALQAQKPIVVVKAGRSKLAEQISVSHTGSLAGADQAFDAFFDRLGIIRVDSPVDLLETLKFLSVSGAPRGNRVAAFTCSGGDAAMVADYCERVGLDLAQPSAATRKALTSLLPDIATAANPLDYTTPLWGNREVMPRVYEALIADGYDAAVTIQDYPPAHIHDDPTYYRNDGLSFVEACRATGIPGASCCDLPENIDPESRAMLIDGGVTPLQGLDTGLKALAAACRYGARVEQLRETLASGFRRLPGPDPRGDSVIVDEWTGKQRLREHGVGTANGWLLADTENIRIPDDITYPVVVKAVSPGLAHKTEIGAVRLGIGDDDEFCQALAAIRHGIGEAPLRGFLVESQIVDVIAELMIGISVDAQFGQVLVIASGGTLVELLRDSATLLLPASDAQIRAALESLQTYPLLRSFRGRPAADLERLVRTIAGIARYAESEQARLLEMDINPLMITERDCIAADVMIRELTAP